MTAPAPLIPGKGLCPLCQIKSTIHHCEAPGCGWKICRCKSTFVKYNVLKTVVYATDGKYYLR